MIKVAVAGGAGRMGGRVAALAGEQEDMKLVGILEREDHPQIGSTRCGAEITADASRALAEADVLVEFTSPAGLIRILKKLEDTSIPLVSGTTGLSREELDKLKESAEERGVFWAPNMSLGVNLLFKLAAQVARALPDYDAEIVEMHHRHKKDAPSGTAAKLAEIIRENKKISKVIYGREGHTGERSADELAVLALRAGDVAGEHTVIYATEGERVELTHRASSRLAFAKGTIAAIRFIVGQPPGFYQYTDLLESK